MLKEIALFKNQILIEKQDLRESLKFLFHKCKWKCEAETEEEIDNEFCYKVL